MSTNFHGAVLSISHKRSYSKTGGFTLTEVAIGSLILLVSIIGVLTLASQSFLQLQTIRQFSRANQILQQKMEDIRLLSFSSIQALPSTFSDPNDTQHFYTGTINQQTYLTDSYGYAEAIKVTLKVTWTSRNGKARTQTLSTVFTNYGLNSYVF